MFNIQIRGQRVLKKIIILLAINLMWISLTGATDLEIDGPTLNIDQEIARQQEFAKTITHNLKTHKPITYTKNTNALKSNDPLKIKMISTK